MVQIDMAKANVMGDALQAVTKDLTEREMQEFTLAFNRQFVLGFPNREVSDIYQRHANEILLGAMVAKEQMDAEIDGEVPLPGRIGGPMPIRAGFLGVGDDWEDIGPITCGAPQHWIHSGTTLMGGIAGHSIRIGDNAVHVIIGIGSLHPEPKMESVKFTIDGKERPIYQVGFANKVAGISVKEFDKAVILSKNTNILADAMMSAIFGATATDYIYLFGASFVAEAQLRIHDPASLPGTTQNLVMVT